MALASPSASDRSKFAASSLTCKEERFSSKSSSFSSHSWALSFAIFSSSFTFSTSFFTLSSSLDASETFTSISAASLLFLLNAFSLSDMNLADDWWRAANRAISSVNSDRLISLSFRMVDAS